MISAGVTASAVAKMGTPDPVSTAYREGRELTVVLRTVW